MEDRHDPGEADARPTPGIGKRPAPIDLEVPLTRPQRLRKFEIDRQRADLLLCAALAESR